MPGSYVALLTRTCLAAIGPPFAGPVAVRGLERYPGLVLAAFLRILLVVAFAVAPVTTVRAMPADVAMMVDDGRLPGHALWASGVQGMRPDLYGRSPGRSADRGCADMPAMPDDPTHSRIGQSVDPDVATPPPRFR